ncbi:cytochrome P450 2F2 [Bombina bombina]|uniref:cytochrome P450 2F2 n=1 Tax=Bombina bombina TaxID=8345 RepID=UPI00235A8E7C|nr:cytochrome P450 2F2 [Bombina bombina]XP_053577650.1 cytochrome P450 2F2 [Bombina bombina]
MSPMDITGLGTLLLVLISIISFMYLTWNQMYRKRNLPPGPTPLPLIGNLLHIKLGEMAGSLIKLWDKYGPVYTLYLGSRPVVFICGYQAVKEAIVDQAEEFGGRGRLPTIDKFTQGYGIGFANGECWKQMRHFSLKTLKDFGLGKKTTELKIQEEAENLVNEIKKTIGLPTDPSKLIMDAVSNIFCCIIFGNQFDYKDEKFSEIFRFAEEVFSLMSTTWGQMEEIFPELMKYIPGPHKKIIAVSEEMVACIQKRVEINQATLDPTCPRDYIDCFLIKMEEEKHNPNTEFTMRNLLISIHSLLLGATDTVGTTLRHALLILLVYPEIQAKLHKEIDQVIGRNRFPLVSDRSQMPYTEAVINEVQRFADIFPLNAARAVTKDTQFRGYTIPKGTDVNALLCTVHRDPTQFSTPYKFNLNHFLDENGGFKKNDAMMAFSAGKRRCPGEGLALIELFLFFTYILQNFTLRSDKKFTDDEIAPTLTGFVNHPKPFQLSFIAR